MAIIVPQVEKCNVCYQCRVFVHISEDPIGIKRIERFSLYHRSHPHGFNPKINLAHYTCVDSTFSR